MTLDPLVLCGFLYVCPEKELSELLPSILPYYSISFMASQLKERKESKTVTPIEVRVCACLSHVYQSAFFLQATASTYR
jgi:hypothetical protein